MSLGPEYWQGQDTLTIEKAAILAGGGDPDKKISSQPNKETILVIEADLRLEVISTLNYARKLVEAGMVGRYVDEFNDFDIFERECNEYGVYFYRSISDDSFAALDESRHPNLDTIKLSVRELKAWLKSHQIISTFFFPNEDSSGSAFIPDKQQKREAVLIRLIDRRGKEELLKLGQTEVWRLLCEERSDLFQRDGRSLSNDLIKAFFRKQNLLKGFKRGPKG